MIAEEKFRRWISVRTRKYLVQQKGPYGAVLEESLEVRIQLKNGRQANDLRPALGRGTSETL
jgi:hypothetical protein